MKNKTIISLSVVAALLVCLVFLVLGFIYDYDSDVETMYQGLTHNADALLFFLTIFADTFVAVAVLLWAFIRTSTTRKVVTSSVVFVIATVTIIRIYYFDDFYFDYIVKDNPYDGYFVRDADKDTESGANFKDQYPEYFRDTIGNSRILVDKYRASLYGNRASMALDYNICLNGNDISFVAVFDYLETADYCKPKTLNVQQPMSFTLTPLGDNSFYCEECKNYLLPIYWKHSDEH